MKLGGHVECVTRKNWFNFGEDPDPATAVQAEGSLKGIGSLSMAQSKMQTREERWKRHNQTHFFPNTIQD